MSPTAFATKTSINNFIGKDSGKDTNRRLMPHVVKTDIAIYKPVKINSGSSDRVGAAAAIKGRTFATFCMRGTPDGTGRYEALYYSRSCILFSQLILQNYYFDSCHEVIDIAGASRRISSVKT